MSVGDVTESVTVQAEGQALQTASSERAGIVTSEEIKDLTVINRDFTSFAELQPGVVINVSQSVQTFSGNNTFNVLGGRTTGNNITVDGLPTSNTNQSNMNTTVSLDNTQTVEVKVSNFSRGVWPQQRICRDGRQQDGHPPAAWRSLLLRPQRSLQRQ